MDYDRAYSTVVLRLPFDETVGSTTTVDLSLVPKTVTLTNVVTDVGLFGNAAKFDASGTGRISVTSHSALDLSTQDFTIDLSVYPTSSATRQTLLSKRASTSAAMWLHLYYDPTGSTMRCETSSDGLAFTNAFTLGNWTLNAWNRIRISRTGTTIQRWLNGTSLGAATAPASVAFDTSPLVIGATASDQLYPLVSASVDEVRIKVGAQAYPLTGTYTPLEEPFDIASFAGKTALVDAIKSYVGGETPAIKTVFMPPMRAYRNYIEIDGSMRIAGTVKEKNTPVNTPLARRVVLLRDIDAQVIRTTISDPVTGAYEFRDLREGLKYTVLAFDNLHNYRAVVADNLEPTL